MDHDDSRITEEPMNGDTAQHRRIWPVVCLSLLLALPVLYVASSGPVLKVAASSPSEHSIVVLAYRPLISFAEAGENNLLQRYLMWWCPEGLVLPIYSANRDLRAREIICTASSEEAICTTTEFEAQALSSEAASLDAPFRDSAIEQASCASDTENDIGLSRDLQLDEYSEAESGGEPALTIDQFSDAMVEILMRKLKENHAAYARKAPPKVESKSHPSDELTRWIASPKAREIERNLGFE